MKIVTATLVTATLVAAAVAAVALVPWARAEEPEGEPAKARGSLEFAGRGAEALPDGAVARMGSTSWRRPPNVRRGHVSADGSRLVLQGSRLFTVLDLESGVVLGRLWWKGEASIDDWTTSADGTTLYVLADGAVASRSFDGSAAFRALESGADDPRLRALAVASQGHVVAAAGGGVLVVWDLENGGVAVAAEDPGAASRTTSATFLADGKTLAVGHVDGSVTFWAPGSATPPRRSEVVEVKDTFGGGFVRLVGMPTADRLGVQYEYTEVERDPDTGDRDSCHVKAVAIWDVATEEVVARHALYYAGDDILALADNGGAAVQAKDFGLSDNHRLSIYDLTLEQGLLEQAHLEQVFAGGLPVGLVRPDGHTYVLMSSPGIRILDLATSTMVKGPVGHFRPVGVMAFSPRGDRLATGGTDGTVRTWDVADGREVAVVRVPVWRDVDAVALDAEGEVLTYTAGLELFTADANTGAARSRHDVQRSMDHSFVSPDGKTAVAARSSSVTVFAVATGKVVQEVELEGRSVTSAAVTPDFDVLVTGHGDGAIQFVGLGAESPARRVEVLPDSINREVSAVAVSADGSTVAAFGYTAKTIVFVDVASGEVRGELNPGEPWLHPRQMALSPDGTRLVTGHERLRVWDVATGGPVAEFPTPGDVKALVFDPSGKLLATAQADGTVLVWKVPDRE